MKPLAPDALSELIDTRRDLHAHPEIGFNEVRTSGIVADRLRALGIDVKTGVAKTGVVGLLRGASPGSTVMLRADMDCLPIMEANDVPYRSQNPGLMHACGHDAHTAILLSTARVLAERRETLKGSVKFIFQPAEEHPGGARPMIEEGVLEEPHVDACFGLHVENDLPCGQVGVVDGPCMANTGVWEANIVGKGGHGAAPESTVDPIVAAAHCVTALQSVVARNVDPLDSAVVTVGMFHAGQAMNIIPANAVLTGTIRSYREEVHTLLERRVEEIVRGVAGSLGATVEWSYTRGYPATVNDPAMCDLVRSVAGDIVGSGNVLKPNPTMGGEDMAYYLRERPGCFFWLGSRAADKDASYPGHNPRFNIVEDCMPIGVNILVGVVDKYLADYA
ncbi:MAG TPA: M20 family metallopeptidase [Armatimonadota bacterium]|jgi:amidohydrolase